MLIWTRFPKGQEMSSWPCEKKGRPDTIVKSRLNTFRSVRWKSAIFLMIVQQAEPIEKDVDKIIQGGIQPRDYNRFFRNTWPSFSIIKTIFGLGECFMNVVSTGKTWKRSRDVRSTRLSNDFVWGPRLCQRNVFHVFFRPLACLQRPWTVEALSKDLVHELINPNTDHRPTLIIVFMRSGVLHCQYSPESFCNFILSFVKVIQCILLIWFLVAWGLWNQLR